MFNMETHMDFEGQGKAEKYCRIIVTLFGLVGLAWGAVVQQFSITVYVLGAGFITAALITIPPWPIYRRKPLNWQKVVSSPNDKDFDGSKKKKK